MSATDLLHGLRDRVRPVLLLISGGALGIAGGAFAAQVTSPASAKVGALLKTRLPKTPLTRIDCDKVKGLCEVTAGSNLFYVDHGARYLIIGRVYDMATRQDLTAARLLEINPDLLIGGAARANAVAGEGGGASLVTPADRPAAATRPAVLSLKGLPTDGAIVWGNPTGRTITIFTDFKCGYCRALSSVLRDMNVRVVERPISVLGSRDLADLVYCAKDRERALHAAYAGEPLTPGQRCDTSGLDANEAFARAHGLGGTPVIVRDDGAVIEGYRPKEFLEDWLRKGRS